MACGDGPLRHGPLRWPAETGGCCEPSSMDGGAGKG